MIVAIGAFDGFHKGHQTLLERARLRASESGDSWGVVTFGKHPERVVGSQSFKALFTLEEQLLLERYFDIPNVFRIDFTAEVAGMSPRTFLDDISGSYGVRGVVVGEDFRFGRGRVGDPELLRREAAARGWSLDIMPLYETCDGTPVCSTAVREAISAGRMPDAWSLLGYPFFCMSRVVHGDGRGRTLGFPTANIEIPGDKADLPDGVYATLVYAGSEWLVGAANIGRNPTFDDVWTRRFEVNLLGYSGDLYGQEIVVFLLEYLRDEIRFEDAAQLSAQVKMDSERIAEIGKAALSSYCLLWDRFGSAVGVLEKPSPTKDALP